MNLVFERALLFSEGNHNHIFGENLREMAHCYLFEAGEGIFSLFYCLHRSYTETGQKGGTCKQLRTIRARPGAWASSNIPGPNIPNPATRLIRCRVRSLSGIAVRDEAKEVPPDARPQARKNRRCIRWNTVRICSGRERRRWSRIVRRS